jgi:hypothetical protein
MPAKLLSDRMVHEEYGYQVPYLGSDAAGLLGEDWRIDNYAYIETMRGKKRWVQKRGPEYLVDRVYDLTGSQAAPAV